MCSGTNDDAYKEEKRLLNDLSRKENQLLTGNYFHNNQVKISQNLLEENNNFFCQVLKKRLRNAMKEEYVLLFVMTLIRWSK